MDSASELSGFPFSAELPNAEAVRVVVSGILGAFKQCTIDQADRRNGATLLVLPDVLLREVLCWSPNSPSANALLNTCKAFRALRQDPVAAALLILRLPCLLYDVALTTCTTCDGGTAAVVQQVLQLVRPGSAVAPGGAIADGASPAAFTASPRLLQALLCTAAQLGNTAHMQALLVLPQPPSLAGVSGVEALLSALCGPHLEAMALLMQRGVQPSTGTFVRAAEVPEALPALPLLLQHCPAPQVAQAVGAALSAAISRVNLKAAAYLAPLAFGAPGAPPAVRFLEQAADRGSNPVLQLLLKHHAATEPELSLCLVRAVKACRLACASLLLDAGADAMCGHGLPLAWARIRERRGALGSGLVGPRDAPQSVGLLLAGRGAAMTPTLRYALARWEKGQDADDSIGALLDHFHVELYR